MVVMGASLLLTSLSGLIPVVAGHAAFFHPSMWGFNVTAQTFPYDNRPVAPLTEYTFDQWWFHGHLGYPPNDGDIFELPAGESATTQVACDKGATTFFASDPGGDIQDGDDPCPGSPPSEYHTTGFDDLKGCALAITYKSNVSDIQPEDFAVFSVNQTCVWYRFTDFQVPARMPACPEGGCICAWFWIHSPDSGGEQNYMNGFRCNVTGATSDVPVATSQVPRRCGADPDNNKPDPNFGNCTWGAKQPFYWLQQEQNNMFEGYYSPPFYTNLYNFLDGAQQDIFEDSYPDGLPTPSVNNTQVPTPNFAGVQPTATPSAPSGLPVAIVGTAPPASATAPLSSSNVATSSSGASIFPPPSSSAYSSSPVNGTSSVSVSVVVSTAIVVSTQVVTVTAALPPASTIAASTIVLSVASAANGSTSALPTPPASSLMPVSSANVSVLTAQTAFSTSSLQPATPSSSASSSGQLASTSSSTSSTSLLPATSTILLNAPSSIHADVNVAAPTASSSSSSPAGFTCAKGGAQAMLAKSRFTRRSTSSGFQSFVEVVKPGAGRTQTRDFRPANRSRLWRIF